ncbi:MAG: polyphosphate:AMP phosphotransferase [Candidatus Hydrogenedentota bacterium]
MLETLDLDAALSKKAYKEAQDTLDIVLPELQRKLHAAAVPAVVVFEGWDAAGKGTVLGRLLQPLDPRGYNVHTIGPPTPEEQLYPPMHRFWNKLPAHGTIGIFDRSWYRQVLDDVVFGKRKGAELQEAYARMRVFERQLADDGVVLVKFFLHISKKEQAKRFKKLQSDPAYAWRVGGSEKKQHKAYDKFYQAVEEMLRETSTPFAPWTLVPATDERFGSLKVAETLAAAFEHAAALSPGESAEAPPPATRRTSPLERVDLSLSIDKDDYDKELKQLQEELRRLQHLCYLARKPVAMVFEGWDAGGKGGNIRRLTRELDPRGYEVIPVAAPAGDEKTHHYLWRFWRDVPKAGHFAIFDRSWYGRVLVERVEGFASPAEWYRAYREVNEFEAELVEAGCALFKFWIHISPEEQLQRFEARQNNPAKQWKITEEDWRNREKWDLYYEAVSDMIERTSTVRAPWTIVEGDDKRYARLKTLRTVTERLQEVLE